MEWQHPRCQSFHIRDWWLPREVMAALHYMMAIPDRLLQRVEEADTPSIAEAVEKQRQQAVEK